MKEPPERDEPVRKSGNHMRLIGGTKSSDKPRLPPGYVLDRSDPDVLVLRDPTARR